MADIAKILNQTSSIKAIDLYYEANFEQRRRLGLSQVGHQCKRFLWYKHHGFTEPVPEGQVLRLFELGKMIEDRVCKDLEQCGFVITKKQHPVELTINGLTLTGSCDGVISGLIESSKPSLWECKSMGSKGFAKLLRVGYEAYNAQYKGQVHAYMLGLGLTRAFVTVYNKDTSELYQERIKLNKDWIIEKLQSVFGAISLPVPPERYCPRATHWEAKFCPFYQECFK